MRRNIRLLFSNELLRSLEFSIPIFALYLQDRVFDIYKITIILAIKALAIIVLEIPTGVIGDVIGRKKTLLASNVAAVVSIMVLVFSDSYAGIIVSVVVSALAYTLSSGTATALLFESVQGIEENRPSFKKMTAYYNSIWPIAASVASLIGAPLASVNLIYPFYLTLIMSTLAIFFLFLILDIETSDEPPNAKDTVLSSFHNVRSSKQLLIIFSVGFFSYSVGEVGHQLKPIYFEYKEIGVAYFGILFALTYGFSFLGSLLSDPLSSRFGNKRVLIVSSFLPISFQISSILTTGLVSGVLITHAMILVQCGQWTGTKPLACGQEQVSRPYTGLVLIC